MAKISAVGLTLLGVALMLLGAAVLLWRLGKVVDEKIDENADVPRNPAKRRCARYREVLIKVLPLTAIKIVVVVWQIITQVRTQCLLSEESELDSR